MGHLKVHHGVIVQKDTGFPVTLFTAATKAPIDRAVRFHEKQLQVPLEFAQIHAVAYQALENAQINREPYLGYCLAAIDSHRSRQRFPPRPPVVEALPSPGAFEIQLGQSVQRIGYWIALLWPEAEQKNMRYLVWKRIAKPSAYHHKWDIWKALTTKPGLQGKARKKPAKVTVDPITHLAQSARW